MGSRDVVGGGDGVVVAFGARVPGRPPRAAPDFALVIGVDDYPRYRGLRGAVGDATAFHAWLCDPDGGNVSADHARLVVSRPDPVEPLQTQVDAALLSLCADAEAADGGGRLYVYFAGHGAMSTTSGDDLALLLAAWSHADARTALSSNAYRSALSSLGVFRELALFLDCCRTTVAAAIGLGPTFDRPSPTPGGARAFVAYASEAGAAAHETATSDGTWRGVFTRELLAILRRGRTGVDASHLKHLLEHAARVTGQRAHVIDGLPPEARFGHRGEDPVFTVIPDDEHDELELFDGSLRCIATHATRDGAWSMPLAAGLYKLRCGTQSQLVDHAGATRIDLRPPLARPVLRMWESGELERGLPAQDAMREAVLDGATLSLPHGIEVVPEGPGYRIVRGRAPLWAHDRVSAMDRGSMSTACERVEQRWLRDGQLYRCGELRILVGDVPLHTRMSGGHAQHAIAVPTAYVASIELLSVKAPTDALIVVYDAIGREVCRGARQVAASLPVGLYRIDAEQDERASSQLHELEPGGGRWTVSVPWLGDLSTLPAVTSANPSSSAPPLGPPLGPPSMPGAGPAVPRAPRRSRTPTLPGVRVAPAPPRVRARLLVRSRGTRVPTVHWFDAAAEAVALAADGDAHACDTPPGTYLLRSAYDLAVSIPRDHLARVHATATGLRITLEPLADGEDVVRTIEQILRGERPAAELAHLAELPDVAILLGRVPTAPPLLRASLRRLMTDPAFDLTGLDPDAPLAQAACRATGDPRWASWHPDPGATAWIAPTLAALPPGDPVALGRRLAIPPACVARAQRR